MIIKKCRNCNKIKFFKLFSLGKMAYTGVFKEKNSVIPEDTISLIMCKECSLVQLDKNFNPKIMYNNNYGYRTGINSTMKNHVKNVTKNLLKKVKLKKNDFVLDIASNDGTLLNYYPRNIKKCGVDPILKKYIKNYNHIDYKVPNFFEYKYIKKLNLKKKFKIITALSVFYDLKKPNLFLKDIKKILDTSGIFFVEFADLISILKYNMFDTICHEHLEYYSFKVMNDMVKKNGLKIIDIRNNNINGGSIGIYITHNNNNKYKINQKNINRIINLEKKFKLTDPKTFKLFLKKILKIKKTNRISLNKIIRKNKTIHGYGASTKGNVLLQFFNFTNNDIKFIADRNPKKSNLYTPGTKIKIISEQESRKKKPDYYYVLPWHFKKEILSREKKIISKGTKFIFPLPNYYVS